MLLVLRELQHRVVPCVVGPVLAKLRVAAALVLTDELLQVLLLLVTLFAIGDDPGEGYHRGLLNFLFFQV